MVAKPSFRELLRNPEFNGRGSLAIPGLWEVYVPTSRQEEVLARVRGSKKAIGKLAETMWGQKWSRQNRKGWRLRKVFFEYSFFFAKGLNQEVAKLKVRAELDAQKPCDMEDFKAGDWEFALGSIVFHEQAKEHLVNCAPCLGKLPDNLRQWALAEY